MYRCFSTSIPCYQAASCFLPVSEVRKAAFKWRMEKLGNDCNRIDLVVLVGRNFRRFSTSDLVVQSQHHTAQLKGVEKSSATRRDDLKSYRQIFLHSCIYKLSKRVSTNRLTRLLDGQQSSVQAEFRMNYSIINNFRIGPATGAHNENKLVPGNFIYKKTFNSIELNAVFGLF